MSCRVEVPITMEGVAKGGHWVLWFLHVVVPICVESLRLNFTAEIAIWVSRDGVSKQPGSLRNMKGSRDWLYTINDLLAYWIPR